MGIFDDLINEAFSFLPDQLEDKLEDGILAHEEDGKLTVGDFDKDDDGNPVEPYEAYLQRQFDEVKGLPRKIISNMDDQGDLENLANKLDDAKNVVDDVFKWL
ncbi:hypothetical protein LC605_09295 [Nostoc sp. CHAB 5836]|uniref:hypothetical protein n=1 Tax=Nostoc sp. CHAB 5836 TaxID=2780404 RepID=UPI001E3BA67A|nr:hypothetical protein [Nostoc sp. CHAB 5836]MCC5615266.1 hypothetical protein [Nostoc sp. CHAB 5836]